MALAVKWWRYSMSEKPCYCFRLLSFQIERRSSRKRQLDSILYYSILCIYITLFYVSILLFFFRENIDLMNDVRAVTCLTPDNHVKRVMEFRQRFSDHNVSFFSKYAVRT